MNSTSIRRLVPALALVVAALAAVPASAGPYDTFVVFGDSLSDNGNNAAAGLFDPLQVITGNTYIPSNTYAPHTYSNGPVWASDFAAMIGLPLGPSLAGGTDFAFGGATTGTAGSGPGTSPIAYQDDLSSLRPVEHVKPGGLQVAENAVAIRTSMRDRG